MKIDKLRREAVRSRERLEKTTDLSRSTLDTLVGGHEGVPPEICAIHFNYPQDALE